MTQKRGIRILLLFSVFICCALSEETAPEVKKEAADHQIQRVKRQNGYGNGNGMWANNGNFPPMGNWNGPNSNGYGGPQPPPDDSIKGSIGTKEEEKKPDENGQQGGQGGWWPNGGNGYNNGPNRYNGNVPNGYGGGFGGNQPEGNVDNGIKGSVGAVVEPTRSPYPPNGYGNRPGYNGYGNQGNFGFNRMAGYGNNFGRPILPRGERFIRGRQNFRY